MGQNQRATPGLEDRRGALKLSGFDVGHAGLSSCVDDAGALGVEPPHLGHVLGDLFD